MPYLGRRDSDYAEMGVSADAVPAPANPLEARAAAVVARVAHDDEDQRLLLEALGLLPTADTLAAAS